MKRLPPTPYEITLPMLAAGFATLTRRECQVLRWIIRGKRDTEIAIILGIQPRTASTHVRNILAKLSVETRLAAAMEVVRIIICRRAPVQDRDVCPCCGQRRRK